MSEWSALMTPQKTILDSLRTLSWLVSYRRLSPQFQFSLSAVTLGIYLCVPTWKLGLEPLAGPVRRTRRSCPAGWQIRSEGQNKQSSLVLVQQDESVDPVQLAAHSEMNARTKFGEFPSEQTICFVHSVFGGNTFFSEIPNPSAD